MRIAFFSWPRRLNPIVGIIASLLLIILGLVFAKGEVDSFILLSLLVFLLIFARPLALLKVGLATGLIGAVFVLITYLSSGGDLESTIGMADRFLVLIAGIGIGVSLSGEILVASLQRMRAPKTMILGLTIASSFPSSLRREIRRVREAMKSRGVSFLGSPRMLYRSLVVPLISRLVDLSDILSISIETRGFDIDGGKMTTIRETGLTVKDLLFGLVAIAAIVLLIIL